MAARERNQASSAGTTPKRLEASIAINVTFDAFKAADSNSRNQQIQRRDDAVPVLREIGNLGP